MTNWAEYDAGLRARGSLTMWFTPEAVEAWTAEPRTGQSGQPTYSALAIAAALTLRAVFRLALRQTEGLIASILQLLGLDLPVPDHSTLSRRAETLDVARPKAGSAPMHLLVGSTGLRLCGAGEWLEEKHGSKRRRAWRVLHLATDANTGRIVASALIDRDADDGSQVGPPLDRIDGLVATFTGDGTTGTTSAPKSRRAIPRQQSSCRRARAPCQATQPRPHQRSAMRICDVSPSAAPWDGSGHRGTTYAPWSRPMPRAGSASSAMGYVRKWTGVRPPRWPSQPAC